MEGMKTLKIAIVALLVCVGIGGTVTPAAALPENTCRIICARIDHYNWWADYYYGVALNTGSSSDWTQFHYNSQLAEQWIAAYNLGC